MNPLDDQTLLKSLRSEICPACGRPKRSHKSFCGSCFHELPRDLAKALYSRIGRGYNAAHARAMEALGKTAFITKAVP